MATEITMLLEVEASGSSIEMAIVADAVLEMTDTSVCHTAG